MNELALFAGAGGGILAGSLVGFRTVCAVEINHYAASVLVARQNDGILPPFPIWDDVQTFDGMPWRGFIDVVSGGFPCQDISKANSSGKGIDGKHSGLWKEFRRIICEVQPAFVFVENSPLLVSRGLHTVLGDLAEIGYNAEWGVLSACSIGAPHSRERMWIVAYSNSSGLQNRWAEIYTGMGGRGEREQEASNFCPATTKPSRVSGGKIWETEPDMGRVVDGVAYQVDRLKSIGNGWVPAVGATAWSVLLQRATGTICAGRAAAEH